MSSFLSLDTCIQIPVVIKLAQSSRSVVTYLHRLLELCSVNRNYLVKDNNVADSDPYALNTRTEYLSVTRKQVPREKL